jgi:tRNA(Ile)-lysidine synthase
MTNELLSIIKENLPKKSAVVLAFSGGPDSVYLLNKLLEIQKNHPLKIIIAHFNHKLRGKDSTKDELFSRNTAENHKLIYETDSLDIKKYAKANLLNLEEAARIKRYEFLEKTRKKYKAEAVLTAHHLDDNLETFIINLLRGSGIQGLKSMQTRNQNILRPLLYIQKTDILKYLKLKKLKFQTDITNNDKSIIRNKIRLDVVPVLKQIQPKLQNTFIYTWENLNELYDFTDNEAKKWITENTLNSDEYNRILFKKLHIFMQKKVLQTIYEKLYGSIAGLTRENLIRLVGHVLNLNSGKKAPFGKKHMLILTRNTFKIVQYKA